MDSLWVVPSCIAVGGILEKSLHLHGIVSMKDYLSRTRH